MLDSLGDVLHRPDSDGYRAATQPRNTTARQRPFAVVQATDADDVRRAVQAARDEGLGVAVQATGHGAAGTIDEAALLIDTSRLAAIAVDAQSRTAQVGAGALWSAVDEAAERHGLLGLAGTAPDVGVVGYTAYGGVGWLTRPYGLASASLRRVEFVDGNGESRVATEDENPDALWAFRGAGGVGVATAVELDLKPIDDLWAGYVLWPIEQAEAVVQAWGAAVGAVGSDLTSTLGFLQAPDSPAVPAPLRGHRVVHLAAASIDGEDGFAPLLDALAAAPSPAINTIGPCDAQRLATIHLDPPVPVPAIGAGRWLSAATPDHVLEILGVHGVGDKSPLPEIEIRHVGSTAGGDVPGALTRTPGPFLLHAVGDVPTADARSGIQAALDAVVAAAEPVDIGRALPSFCDGQPTVPDALADGEGERLAAVRRRFDPADRIRPARVLR